MLYSKKKEDVQLDLQRFYVIHFMRLSKKKGNLINFEDKVQKYRGKYPFPDAIETRAASLIATDSFPSTGRARTAVTLFVGPLEQGPFMAQVTGRETRPTEGIC